MSLPFSTSAVPVSSPTPAGVAPPTFAQMFERNLVGPLFAPWAEHLLDCVSLPEHARVLDVACGTGIVSRVARRRMRGEGRLVGVDLSPVMLATAREVAPDMDWREGSAERLPVADDERFDAVLCQQGMQFFGDPGAAAREMRRVLAPGGRVAASTWRPVEENAVFHDFAVIAERFLGPVVDVRYGLADGDALAGLLRDGGLADVRIESVSLEVRFEGEPVVLARMNAMALVGMSARGKGMPDAERAALAAEIAAASVEGAARYRRDGALVFPTSANVATARA